MKVAGLPTNQAFLQRLAAQPEFQAAQLDTSFIQKHGEELLHVQLPDMQVAAVAAIAR